MSDVRPGRPEHVTDMIARIAGEGFESSAPRGAHRLDTGRSRSATIAMTAGIGAIVAGGSIAGAGAAVANPLSAETMNGTDPLAGLIDLAKQNGVEIPDAAALPELPGLPQLNFGSSAGKTVRPADGVLTSGFGPRWGSFHDGVDIAGPIGTPIWAVSDGVVVDSGPAGGYGLWIRVKHDDGTVSLYGHNNENLVAKGQRVFAGQQIGTVGNRGFSTGPHLHFGIYNPDGTAVNPQDWLGARGISL